MQIFIQINICINHFINSNEIYKVLQGMKNIAVYLLMCIYMTTDMSAQSSKSFLALGDSYTIGESVPIFESFPYQTLRMLREAGVKINAPEIVAKTGWTSDELLLGIENSVLLKKYDYVTLLIGVNNQYRGRNITEFKDQFKILLKKAIAYSGGKLKNVVVLSIPDWGVSPFAQGRDRNKIATEIDAFNLLIKQISSEAGVRFLNITNGTREATNDPSLLAHDKLHPSGKEYKRWADRLSKMFLE